MPAAAGAAADDQAHGRYHRFLEKDSLWLAPACFSGSRAPLRSVLLLPLRSAALLLPVRVSSRLEARESLRESGVGA